jgi:exopolysaccharide production protein ExoQ
MRRKRTTGSGDVTGKPSIRLVGAVDRGAAWQSLWCFASLTALLFQTAAMNFSIPGGATGLVLLFLILSSFIGLRLPHAAFDDIVRNWPLLVLPAIAVTSTVWSDYPDWSLRAGIQFLMTVIIGVIMGSCVKPRAMISALFLALAFVTVLGVFFGGLNGTPIGFFGSKNYYGYVVGLLWFVALTVFVDRSQPRLLRVVGLTVAGLAPPLLIGSGSTGALVDSIAVVAIMMTLEFASRLEAKLRVGLLAFLCFVVLQLLIISWVFADEIDQVLQFFGKDLTLTGRTMLWETAYASIADNPIIGVGFQAFWRPENWKAQYLWIASHEPIGAGFHFHNTYLAVTVDLGVVGLFAFIAIIVVVLGRVGVILIYLLPNPAQKLSIACLAFFMLRSPIEVDLFGQFSISTILMSWIWINTKLPRGVIQARSKDGGGGASARSRSRLRPKGLPSFTHIMPPQTRRCFLWPQTRPRFPAFPSRDSAAATA